MLIVHGQSRVSVEHRARYIESARKSAEGARAESGNIAYIYSSDIFDPELIHTIEIWESEQAFREHVEAPHHIRRIGDITEMGARPHSVQIFEASPGMDYQSWKAGTSG